MKKLLYLIIFGIALGFNSCTDFVEPAIPYNNFETGVYLRTISSTPNFNFFALETSNFELTVEAVDEENGNLVQELDIYARRRRGNTLSQEAKVTTIPKSEFKPNDQSKYLRAKVIVNLLDAITKMGFTLDDISGGDFIEFRLDLLDTKGRRWTNSNLSGDIAGGAYYRSPFFYRVPVVCPSELAGIYDLSTTGWCGEVYNGKVEFVKGSTTGTYIIKTDVADGTFVEDFSFGFYQACYGSSTAPPGGADGLRLTDACGQIGFNSAVSSPWGDNFSITDVQVDGPKLTLGIESSFPPEAGTAVITRTDGSNWPPLRK